VQFLRRASASPIDILPSISREEDSDRDVLSFAVRVVWDQRRGDGSACPPAGRLSLDLEGLRAERSNSVCLCDEEIYVLVDLGWRQRPFGAEFETYMVLRVAGVGPVLVGSATYGARDKAYMVD
jgi:hypothetical protein